MYAVLFDLDGTLVDTAPDLAYALNQLLQSQGKAELPFEQIRPVASHGARGLLQLGFGIGPEHADYPRLVDRFLAIYQLNLSRHSQLFDGMAEVLTSLESQGIAWGVVTNKPTYLTEPLLRQLGLKDRCQTLVCGDTLPQRKPDPAPLQLAASHLRIAPQHCLYIGDAERDIEAGRNAGMATAVALYGYIATDDQPEHWQADYRLAKVEHLLPSLLPAWMSARALCC